MSPGGAIERATGPVPVVLDPGDLLIAQAVGLMRQAAHVFLRSQDKWFDTKGRAAEASMLGAAGEAAVAKWLGVYWAGALGDPHGGDVGRWEVRTTTHAHGCLCLGPRDHDDRPYVLVTGNPPELVLRGWIYGRDGKRPEYWGNKGVGGADCFWVPQSALRPMVRRLPA